MGKGRGRHQSTDKEGKRTIDTLERIPGVEAVFINRSIGGKSIGRKRAVGDFKLQGEMPGGFRGILQTSKGIQEIFIRVSRPADAELRRRLKAYSV
ncbi:MAG: hypothetical protein ACI906_004118 [Candidatus Latescibacterota bacterium]|jgi:hypothetical protein